MVSCLHPSVLPLLPPPTDPSGHSAANAPSDTSSTLKSPLHQKRMAFIPSIFTRDVSSSAAGFLAIRVPGSAISTYPYPYTTLSVKSNVRIPRYAYYMGIKPLSIFVYSEPSVDTYFLAAQDQILTINSNLKQKV